jgi:hypothetical protein
MRKFALALTLCGLLSGCGMLGGPSEAKIEEVARQEMVASAPTQATKAFAQSATITKKGLCNSQSEPGTYVCMVDVSLKIPGQSEQAQLQTMVVKLKKNPAGDWVSAD